MVRPLSLFPFFFAGTLDRHLPYRRQRFVVQPASISFHTHEMCILPGSSHFVDSKWKQFSK